jgi:hypothetical protein
MAKKWEHQEEFDKLYNRRNLIFLYKIARVNGSIKTLKWIEKWHSREEKKEEKYVLIASDKDWTAKIKGDSGAIVDSVDLTRFVELLILSKMTGFHHYKISFIIKENIPNEDYIAPVAMHEITEIGLEGIGESSTLDVSYHIKDDKERKRFLEEEMGVARRYPHQEACKAELQLVFNKGEEFSRGYS